MLREKVVSERESERLSIRLWETVRIDNIFTAGFTPLAYI